LWVETMVFGGNRESSPALTSRIVAFCPIFCLKNAHFCSQTIVLYGKVRGLLRPRKTDLSPLEREAYPQLSGFGERSGTGPHQGVRVAGKSFKV
jgi:hypothetical protein